MSSPTCRTGHRLQWAEGPRPGPETGGERNCLFSARFPRRRSTFKGGALQAGSHPHHKRPREIKSSRACCRLQDGDRGRRKELGLGTPPHCQSSLTPPFPSSTSHSVIMLSLFPWKCHLSSPPYLQVPWTAASPFHGLATVTAPRLSLESTISPSCPLCEAA